MIVTKKAISRRTVLRGMGTAVALPLLDAMVPALTAQVKTPAKAVRRFGVVYHPNGVIYENWLPKGVGRDFVLSRTLAPLEPFRDQLIVVTNLSSHQAEALGDGGGDHSRASGTYLTGVHVKKSDSIVENGISMDQIAARALEKETQLSSLQLTADDNSLVGACDVGYSCAYSSTLSWRTPTLPLMAENNPRVVFERLFGSSDSTDAAGARVAPAAGSQHSRLGHGAREAAAADARAHGHHEVERLPRVAARHGTPHSESRGAAHEAGSRGGTAVRRARRFRAARRSCSTTCSCWPTSPT